MKDDSNSSYFISVETSGTVGSVAIGKSARVLAEQSFSTRFQHGVELLPTADKLCVEAGIAPRELAHVYVSGGPGSFTGLRIGITFAKMLAFAAGARVIRVPTLEAIAQNVLGLSSPPSRVAVILDAKRQNVYCASFELSGGIYHPIDQPAEREPHAYLSTLGEVGVVGEGIAQHEAVVTALSNVVVLPKEMHAARACKVAELGYRLSQTGHFTDLNRLAPIYIRRPEAEERWEQRNTTDRT